MDDLDNFNIIGGSSKFYISKCKKYLYKEIKHTKFVKKNNENYAYKKLSKSDNYKNIIPKFYGETKKYDLYYSILENLQFYFYINDLINPNIIDFKIGIGKHKLYSHRLKGKKEKYFSNNIIKSINIGLQLNGLKNNNLIYHKKYGKIIEYDENNLTNIIKLFLTDNDKIRYDLIPKFINELQYIEKNISIRDPIFDTSLLMLWKDDKILCKLIDFGKYNCEIYKQFYKNEKYNFSRGIIYLIKILKNIKN